MTDTQRQRLHRDVRRMALLAVDLRVEGRYVEADEVSERIAKKADRLRRFMVPRADPRRNHQPRAA